jgi:hypothetical protein
MFKAWSFCFAKTPPNHQNTALRGGRKGMTDMTDKSLFIEEIVLNSVKKLLSGRVNELLRETEFMIPPIEFGQGRNSPHKALGGYYAVSPEISLAGCERSEKERIVRMECFTVTVSFSCGGEYGERNCYAYAASVAAALKEDPTLGGVADRAVLAGKKYSPPKCAGTGEEWGITLTLRITTEGIGL